MFDKELEATLNQALRHAQKNRHAMVTTQHLFLALLDNESAAKVLFNYGVCINSLRKQISMFIEQNAVIVPPSDGEHEPEASIQFQKALQQAIFNGPGEGNMSISGVNVLLAVINNDDGLRAFLRSDVVTQLCKLQGQLYQDDSVNFSTNLYDTFSDISDDVEEVYREHTENDEEIENPLSEFAVNLNQKVKLGKTDPLIGREHEVKRTIQILCRRRKNNPLFVGEAGVGKTALAEGLAKKIVEGNVPTSLQDCVVYSLDIGMLLSGTKYRGDFEKRLKSILNKLCKDTKSILFIDEIHTIIGAGATGGNGSDIANLIKPILVNGDLCCMGSTTFKEYRETFNKDQALSRRFQKIDVKEPSVKETYKILKGLKSRFEHHHQVKYTLPALKAAAELSHRYIRDRFLPDKAIDIIDEVGAFQALQPLSKRKKVIGLTDIYQVIANIAQVPSQQVSSNDKEILKNLGQMMRQNIYGQDEAIDSLVAAVKLARSGLGDQRKPMGSFLFSGATGVGKTELARQLAQSLGIKLLRFDMSEYMEKHTVSRFIGAPPGYVGSEQGGLLTEQIIQEPYAVVLLDEIEKAHSEILNILLQVMDYGTLTDAHGRIADFRHAIIVMTTNAGADVAHKSALGFHGENSSSPSMLAIENIFTAEFRNRLDAIIHFNNLDYGMIDKVVKKFVHELQLKLKERNVTIKLDKNAYKWLHDHGYDRKMGARPMARVLQEYVKKPLADELLFGKLDQGGIVRVKVKNDKLAFVYQTKVKLSRKMKSLVPVLI